MSNFSDLFGGGAAAVPIGGYVMGNLSSASGTRIAPSIIKDGAATYIATGTVASSVDYPLAPYYPVAAFSKFILSGSPAVTSAEPYFTTNRRFVVYNGLNILAFHDPSYNDGTTTYYTSQKYIRSIDGGKTFTECTLPNASANITFKDCIFANGFYWLVVDNGFSQTYPGVGVGPLNSGVYRSATGADGSWSLVFGYNSNSTPRYEFSGLAFGNGVLAMVGTLNTSAVSYTHLTLPTKA